MRGEMSGRVVISWTKGETRCRGLMLRVAVSALQDTAFHVRAEVVELVDALDSKSSGRKPVGVRFPPSAPKNAISRRGLCQVTRSPLLTCGCETDAFIQLAGACRGLV